MQLSATEVRILSRLIERTLALPPDQREAYLAALPGPQQALVPRIRERLTQLALTEAEAEVAVAPPPPRVARPEVRVGPYRLLEPLNGRDDARIWRAERAERADPAPGAAPMARRGFALCLPSAADPSPDTPAAARRIAAERQVVPLPEHPLIVRLIDAGIDAEGRFYRVLPYVEGQGLVTHAQRRGLGLHKRVALLADACRLLAHVHDGEVACTDLSAAHFRVDEEGRVCLLDWGRGRSLRADTRAADIRSLGGLLQALLAGDDGAAAPKPLPPGPDLDHVLRRARHAGGAAPQAGYGSVAALLDDLALVLHWQPVPGAAGDAMHHARLWLRRHRAQLALGTLAGVLLLAGGYSGWLALQRGQGQTQRADAARLFLQEQLPEALPAGSGAPASPGAADSAVPVAPDLAVEAPRVQQALEKARMGFAGEPVLRGQVITALGVRFRVLGQPDQALAVLQEAVTLLQGTSRADEPALGAARAELARQHLLDGHPAGRERARSLAQQVLATCTGNACTAGRAAAQQVLAGLGAGAAALPASAAAR